jgi:hypothetical protein
MLPSDRAALRAAYSAGEFPTSLAKSDLGVRLGLTARQVAEICRKKRTRPAEAKPVTPTLPPDRAALRAAYSAGESPASLAKSELGMRLGLTARQVREICRKKRARPVPPALPILPSDRAALRAAYSAGESPASLAKSELGVRLGLTARRVRLVCKTPAKPRKTQQWQHKTMGVKYVSCKSGKFQVVCRKKYIGIYQTLEAATAAAAAAVANHA